jgi:hypothetical protein
MRWVLLPLTVAVSMSGGQTAPAAAPVPVVVELFTSEGCSSCPPADALLSKLAREQSVPGAQIIPLGMHVTYWNSLGWKDPASLQSATDRQQHYGAEWSTDRIYTPQAVVDGREELVASDEAGLTRAISRAARQPHARVAFTAAIEEDWIVTTLAVSDVPADVKEPLDAAFFVTEDRLTSVVKRGENGGRTLHHDAVVRLAREGWDLDLERPARSPVKLSIRDVRREWAREHLNAVVVLYGRKSSRIYGSAIASLK